MKVTGKEIAHAGRKKLTSVVDGTSIPHIIASSSSTNMALANPSHTHSYSTILLGVSPLILRSESTWEMGSVRRVLGIHPWPCLFSEISQEMHRLDTTRDLYVAKGGA